jgi:hypothetical protein
VDEVRRLENLPKIPGGDVLNTGKTNENTNQPAGA